MRLLCTRFGPGWGRRQHRSKTPSRISKRSFVALVGQRQLDGVGHFLKCCQVRYHSTLVPNAAVAKASSPLRSPFYIYSSVLSVSFIEISHRIRQRRAIGIYCIERPTHGYRSICSSSTVDPWSRHRCSLYFDDDGHGAQQYWFFYEHASQSYKLARSISKSLSSRFCAIFRPSAPNPRSATLTSSFQPQAWSLSGPLPCPSRTFAIYFPTIGRNLETGDLAICTKCGWKKHTCTHGSFPQWPDRDC